MARKSVFGPALVGTPLVAFLLLPPIALVVRGHSSFAQNLSQPESREAILVSLRTTFVALGILIVLGMPLGWAIARSSSRFARFVDGIIDLPLVLPPAAAGIALLLALGRNGLVPTGLPFTAGAVVAAQVFVAAPLFLRAAIAAFSAVPEDVVEMARSEGAKGVALAMGIVLPLSGRTLMGGMAMTWARALGEFGATILFAGSFQGRTETLPLAIYLGFETDLDQAVGLSLLLLLVAAVVLVLGRVVAGERAR